MLVSHLRNIVLVFVVFTCLHVFAQEESIPQFPEWMVKKRIDALNYQTPIQLDYNETVQAYIDVYTVKRRDHLANIISRSKLYFPLFEEYLDKYNLPLELKYLAVIESALDPRAKSKSGAKGLWQFLYHAGTMFDLDVSTYIDERSDPILATEAACKYLEYLYRNFNDWQLALAAYNGGVGMVKNAIERSGGKRNYWELRPYLPTQVKGYVPAFIGALYAMKYAENYDINEVPAKYNFHEIDTVDIRKTLSFKQISDASGVSVDEVAFLNPTYTKEIIPVDSKPVSVFLPKKNIPEFVKNEYQVYGEQKQVSAMSESPDREIVHHIVAKGEYFHKIAIKYECTIEDIMKWNHMSSKDLHPGQILEIWKIKEDHRFFFVRDEVDYLVEK
ncbi:lytic transglycosylase domain-containing protein [Plebeiibacterium sediminum]|uniref:Transglycosylase SLT domain-containing protein n=1 Tax=Plebeiibacterium sediminum TaxID=2992112 RepID=A0AAE3M336_9BACT|nr:lytic transglycosylase domain-containing protein [Plebeiobacterium sediminum]MCW3786341.1 transglycosylase SLT domain-containing protein [Plebeiobacterium sediminum]